MKKSQVKEHHENNLLNLIKDFTTENQVSSVQVINALKKRYLLSFQDSEPTQKHLQEIDNDVSTLIDFLVELNDKYMKYEKFCMS